MLRTAARRCWVNRQPGGGRAERGQRVETEIEKIVPCQWCLRSERRAINDVQNLVDQ